MSKNSNNRGRAYEYAWIHALHNALRSVRRADIIMNSSFDANERAWSAIGDKERELLKISAEAAVDTILEMEPLMVEEADDELVLEFQQDGAGKAGDVRDIVVKRNSAKWEIGFSIKHNHEAVKHSRLSHRLDFGREWFGIPCSDCYWEEVGSVFDRLKLEKRKGTKWCELTDKESMVYIPLLKAFMNEITRAYDNNPDVARKMVEYLVGSEDYYKVISHDSKMLTVVRTFNFRGTLNKPSRVKVSAISVPKVNLPTELVTIKLKANSTNTVEMYLNNGWQLSFRIHSAKKEVEPSLKFDVQFIGMPVSVLSIECKWK